MTITRPMGQVDFEKKIQPCHTFVSQILLFLQVV